MAGEVVDDLAEGDQFGHDGPQMGGFGGQGMNILSRIKRLDKGNFLTDMSQNPKLNLRVIR